MAPEFPRLRKQASDFEGAGVFGELIEADALGESVALGACEGFQGKLDAAVGAVLDCGMCNGRQGIEGSPLDDTVCY